MNYDTSLQTWKWRYLNNGYLGVSLIVDGKELGLSSNYMLDKLWTKPKDGESFSVQDARMYTAFEEGLRTIRMLNEDQIMQLAINAVACQRFVLINPPASQHFATCYKRHLIKTGDIVTVYTKMGTVGDCLVLEARDGENLSRLMLLNKVLYVKENKGFRLCDMIRINSDFVHPSRFVKQRNRLYA